MIGQMQVSGMMGSSVCAALSRLREMSVDAMEVMRHHLVFSRPRLRVPGVSL